jgi:hypothetical protein
VLAICSDFLIVFSIFLQSPLEYIRMRSKTNELLIAPCMSVPLTFWPDSEVLTPVFAAKDFIMVVVQQPDASFGSIGMSDTHAS